jgi:hypothetical protein
MDIREAKKIVTDAAQKWSPMTDEIMEAIEALRAEEEVAA